jgi:hypothetical protein
MLEKETSDILRTLTGRSLGARQAISLQEVLSTDLPRGVKAYLHTQVQQWLLEDLARSPRFSRIQASDRASTRHLDVLVRSMAEHYVFMRDEFLTTLEHAVLFTLNYLCRPHRTLGSFLFSSTSVITVETLRAQSRYVSDYQYLFSILDTMVIQRGLKEIEETEFRSLLMEIDRQVVRQHTARELAVLAKPIFTFLLLGNASRDALIPVKPVLAFFEDKQMKEVADFIEKLYHVRSRTEISLTGLAEVLEDLLGTTTTSEPPVPPPAESATLQESAPPVEQPATTTEIAQPVPAEEVRPSAPVVGTMREEEKEVVPPPVAPTGEPVFDDIRAVITPDQRQRFIRTICGKDEAFYEALMVKFNSMRKWSDASEYLRDIFAVHGIDPFSPVAVELTDVIQRRFSEEGKGDQ